MTAAEWLSAARASGLVVYLDPRPAEPPCFYIQRPVDVGGFAPPRCDRSKWPALDAVLEVVGRNAVFLELQREVRAGV